MHFVTGPRPREVGRPLARRRRDTRPRLPRSFVLALILLALGLLAGAGARAQSQGGADPAAPASSTATLHAPVLAGGAPRRAAAGIQPVPPPEDVRDLPAWLDYRTRNHLAALPLEARIFYRRGLALHEQGNDEEAIRLVRGAAELDPAFVAPHLTLASWQLLHEPSQALLQYAAVIELARENFPLQIALAGNVLHLLLAALFLGFLAAGLMLIGLHHRELRHSWIERLGRFSSPVTARWWAWAILLLPLAGGFGLALPAVVFLALLRPSLRLAERMVMLGLLALTLIAPWAVGTIDRLAAPIGSDRAPFWGVPQVVSETPDETRAADLAALAQNHPSNPFVQFAAAWTARRSGDLVAAEAGYRRALRLWPDDDRVLNNLGNVLAMQGRSDEALEAYRRASRVNPSNAAATFNASQIYTQRFDYHAATDAISRASALDFDLVKTYQSQATDDGVLPLADQWIAPKSFWAAMALRPALPAAGTALPPGWRSAVECSGWAFSIAVLVLAALALLLGGRMNRSVPLRACSNCGTVICRRCAHRRRETALCPTCAAAEARAETPDFARVLLLQCRRQVRTAQRRIVTVLAILIPGFGLLSFRRVVPALLILSLGGALAVVGAGLATPFTYEMRPAAAPHDVPLALIAAGWVVVYGLSILGYFAQRARADAEEAANAAPVRSRIRLSTRDRAPLAA